MSNSTRATVALEASGVAFTIHTYEYDPGADRVGLQAAEALGEQPRRVLKTLMAEVDGKPVCTIVPSDREVCVSAWKKDPLGGVIGVQKGPLC